MYPISIIFYSIDIHDGIYSMNNFNYQNKFRMKFKCLDRTVQSKTLIFSEAVSPCINTNWKPYQLHNLHQLLRNMQQLQKSQPLMLLGSCVNLCYCHFQFCIHLCIYDYLFSVCWHTHIYIVKCLTSPYYGLSVLSIRFMFLSSYHLNFKEKNELGIR